jgi:hypothetical protein
MWAVLVRWLGKGSWQEIEVVEGYDLADDLAWAYRDERHAARLRLKVEPATFRGSDNMSDLSPDLHLPT